MLKQFVSVLVACGVVSSLAAKEFNRVYVGPNFLWGWEHSHPGVHSDTYMNGVNFGFESMKPQNLYFGFDVSANGGKTKYQVNKSEKLNTKVDSVLGNMEARLGYNMQPTKHSRITPFLGFGSFHYGVDARKVFDVETGNIRKDWTYASVGLRNLFDLTSHLSLGLNLEAMRTVYSQQTLRTGSYNVSWNSHQKFWGYQAAMPIIFKLGEHKRWDVEVQPYYLRLDSQDDNNIVGSKVLLGYRF